MTGTDRCKDRKIAVVTGGAAGIGAAIARRLVQDGYRVAVLDLMERTHGEPADPNVLHLVADVTSERSVAAAYDTISNDLGPVDLLVNNAGVCPVAPFMETSIADLQRTLRVNVEGTFICARLALPAMIERRAGAIVNMSSWIGRNGQPFFAAYSASKAAIIALTQALACEVAAHGVRVNAVCPGIVVATPMRTSIEDAHRAHGLPCTEERTARVPIGRAAKPDDVTGVVAFLASDDARYIVGEAIGVSGGIR